MVKFTDAAPSAWDQITSDDDLAEVIAKLHRLLAGKTASIVKAVPSPRGGFVAATDWFKVTAVQASADPRVGLIMNGGEPELMLYAGCEIAIRPGEVQIRRPDANDLTVITVINGRRIF